jgi:hypothetical protein
MLSFVLGALLAIAALAFVLYPLFIAPRAPRAATPAERAQPPHARDADAGVTAGESGFAEGGAATPDEAAADDPVEAAIRRQRTGARVCVECGPRPEPDAIFCSRCGRYLSPLCPHCGSSVARPAARFCDHCGGRFAAPPPALYRR